MWQNTGIGAIANSCHVLPIAMLPRLNMILVAFLPAGCEFEGAQAALTDALFVKYPSIVDFVFIYASLLNSLAKLMQRRTSDWIFTPTILLLSTQHFVREGIAHTKSLGIGRLITIMQPQDFIRLTIIDLFGPETALQVGGNAKTILIFKLVVVAINLLPLVFSESMSTKTTRY